MDELCVFLGAARCYDFYVTFSGLSSSNPEQMFQIFYQMDKNVTCVGPLDSHWAAPAATLDLLTAVAVPAGPEEKDWLELPWIDLQFREWCFGEINILFVKS